MKQYLVSAELLEGVMQLMSDAVQKTATNGQVWRIVSSLQSLQEYSQTEREKKP